MLSLAKLVSKKGGATSCGTVVTNKKGEILLCHGTGTNHWDIPKGMQDAGESTLEAAKRELWEEAGIEFDEELFEEIGCFDYRKDKMLHLIRSALQMILTALSTLTAPAIFRTA